MTPTDLDDLRRAKRLLEQISLTTRLADIIGRPLETLLGTLPPGGKDLIDVATSRALHAALNGAVRSSRTRSILRTDAFHTTVVAATGAIGGAFGIPALLVELPVSTTFMLRSIVAIAGREGTPMTSEEARLECLQVFALGGPTTADDAAKSGYFIVRAALARALQEASGFVATHGVTRKGAPLLVRFLAEVAGRFGAQVSAKAAAQSVPVVGAVGGAAINVAFITHFQNRARGHFIVRRLERTYGEETVRAAYVTP